MNLKVNCAIRRKMKTSFSYSYLKEGMTLQRVEYVRWYESWYENWWAYQHVVNYKCCCVQA